MVKVDRTTVRLRNPDILIGVDDLTDLSYLHEPAVLYNLQVRFEEQHAIYTYCGIVLVAINPYDRLPLYTPDVMTAYNGKVLGELDPHIFAVAEDAMRCLLQHGRNQSIIVSGESGAGKTVSAKYAMRYFASAGGATGETSIERKILASNPIMEALGNAKTTRNDNSSRFGKYLQIAFGDHGGIVGASMRTYLLEKSRVVFQAPTERNYHIFYQLCSAAGEPAFTDLELGQSQGFAFTNQGQAPVIANVDDRQLLAETQDAMTVLGIASLEQANLFRLLAGILHLGNVPISARSRRNDDAKIDEGDTHGPATARLLGLDYALLQRWIINRSIATGREVYTKPVSAEQAVRARDALAKHIYAHLFTWVVDHINQAFAPCGIAVREKGFIGVLDIYGFETFQVNRLASQQQQGLKGKGGG